MPITKFLVCTSFVQDSFDCIKLDYFHGFTD